MTMIRVLAAMAALWMVAGCSSTQTTASNTAAENTVASSDDEGLICKRVQVTGTRMTEKVCTTAAEREARSRNAQDAHSQIGIKAQQVGGPAGG